jgi:hypothetical protein
MFDRLKIGNDHRVLRLGDAALAFMFSKTIFHPCILVCLFSCQWCSSLQGQAADPRAAILVEASKVTPLPVPRSVTFADVIGGKGGEEHAFFIKLPNTSALVLATEVKEIDEIRFRGQKVELGRLLRKLPFPVPGHLWVWETKLPQGAAPLIRSQAKLPLMRRDDEFIVLTKSGPQAATMESSLESSLGSEQALLPGQRISDHGSIKLKDRKGAEFIKPGDPILHAPTGIVVGSVIWVTVEYIGRLPTCLIAFLTFPELPEKLAQPMTEAWGIPVPSTPALDDAFVQKIIPLRAIGLKIGEKIQEAWMRDYHLTRPNDSRSRGLEIDYFGTEWLFKYHVVKIRGVNIATVNYENVSSFPTGEQITLMAEWLAQKFGEPVQLHGEKGKRSVLALWERSPAWIAFICSFDTDGTLHPRIHVSNEGEASIKREFQMKHFTDPIPASAKAFLDIVQSFVKQAEAIPAPSWKIVSLSTPFRNTGSDPKKKK